ncbi:MAG: SRPBCC family protein [Bacteroidota bacterium]
MKSLNKLAQEGKINEHASIRDSHSIIINASIDNVWKILTDIDHWNSWNNTVKTTKLEGNLVEGSFFDWRQGRNQIKSQIQLLKKPTSFAWTSESKWVKRISVWSLVSDENQTIATVSTSLQGPMVVIVENHQKIYDELLNWLECLKSEAEEV